MSSIKSLEDKSKAGISMLHSKKNGPRYFSWVLGKADHCTMAASSVDHIIQYDRSILAAVKRIVLHFKLHLQMSASHFFPILAFGKCQWWIYFWKNYLQQGQLKESGTVKSPNSKSCGGRHRLALPSLVWIHGYQASLFTQQFWQVCQAALDYPLLPSPSQLS